MIFLKTVKTVLILKCDSVVQNLKQLSATLRVTAGRDGTTMSGSAKITSTPWAEFGSQPEQSTKFTHLLASLPLAQVYLSSALLKLLNCIVQIFDIIMKPLFSTCFFWSSGQTNWVNLVLQYYGELCQTFARHDRPWILRLLQRKSAKWRKVCRYGDSILLPKLRI